MNRILKSTTNRNCDFAFGTKTDARGEVRKIFLCKIAKKKNTKWQQ